MAWCGVNRIFTDWGASKDDSASPSTDVNKISHCYIYIYTYTLNDCVCVISYIQTEFCQYTNQHARRINSLIPQVVASSTAATMAVVSAPRKIEASSDAAKGPEQLCHWRCVAWVVMRHDPT